MKQRNAILGLIVIAAVALTAFILVQYTSKSSSNTGTSAATSTPKAWKTYTDAIGEYSISYPGEYSVFPADTKDPSFAQPQGHTIISAVGFGIGQDTGPGDGFSVSVSSTTYTDPFKWMINQDKIVASQDKYGSEISLTSVIEKHTNIDGVDGIVTYQKDNVESFPNELDTVFIKNGKVYEIRTLSGEAAGAFDDEQRVWDSFHFLSN